MFEQILIESLNRSYFFPKEIQFIFVGFWDGASQCFKESYSSGTLYRELLQLTDIRD